MQHTAMNPSGPDLLAIRRRTRQRKQLDLSAVISRGLRHHTDVHKRRATGVATSPVPCTMDRFIPSRLGLDIALISSEIQESEQRFDELIPRIVERLEREGDDTDAVLTRQYDESQLDRRKEGQLEVYRRAIRAALHNIPLDEYGPERTPDPREIQTPTVDGNSHASRGLATTLELTNLAYASVQQMESLCSTGSLNGRYGLSAATRDQRRSLLNFGSLGRPVRHQTWNDPDVHSHHKVIQRAVASPGNNELNPSRLALMRSHWTIPAMPTRVMDAPDVMNDYYLNLISWSKDNVLAVALGRNVYLWNASTEKITHVVELDGNHSYVASVSWSTIPGWTRYLAIGTSDRTIEVWDTEMMRRVRHLRGHGRRVCALTWNESKEWLTSGSRDSRIHQHDLRCPFHHVATYRGHAREVCGLTWDEEGHCLASGGNDNNVCIWDASMSNRNSRIGSSGDFTFVSPRFTLTDHSAAVKALDWCPFNRGMLASGGGTADRTIKFWNTVSGKMMRSVDTGSQVCSLIWSHHSRELCSAHGFGQNQLIVWDFVTMTRIQELKSHCGRVLCMEMSPNGSTVASIGADDTLRLWNVFAPRPKSSRRRQKPVLMGGLEHLGPFTVR